ncbi:MAG: manganese efflux pump [Clostridia bacterium]|nr:manganese efflux pump [Clostridia bacterium]
MFLSSILLACCLSIDSIGIGVTYGIRGIKILNPAKVIIFFISFSLTLTATIFGNILFRFIPLEISKIISSAMIILLAVYMLIEGLKKDRDKSDKRAGENPGKEKMSPANMGIKVMKRPESIDIDKSKSIDWFEAVYISLTLSIDSCFVGIGSVVYFSNVFIFPLLIGLLQTFLISSGYFIGKYLLKYRVDQKIFIITSAIILIIIAVCRYIY